MRVQYLTFVDSASYLAMPLRKLPEAFGLAATKIWYPIILTRMRISTMSVQCPIGVTMFITTYVVLSEKLCWRGTKSGKAECYITRACWKSSQDDVTVLRQTCQTFHRDCGNRQHRHF
jgi:hypothetical protein